MDRGGRAKNVQSGDNSSIFKQIFYVVFKIMDGYE
jgi:hypothetical protein